MNALHDTADQIAVWKSLVTPSLCPDQRTFERFCQRIEEGNLTRAENPASHFDVHFCPINPKTKEVFLTLHKKSNLWLFPGGHLELGETPDQAVNREIEEELGVSQFFKETPEPFLFSIVDIDRNERSCKTHHDLWYRMETDGADFVLDPSEFHQTGWMTITKARTLVTDPNNLVVLERIENSFH